MTPNQWFKIKMAVQEALELAPEERARFLDGRCGEDDLVRSEAAALLRASENIGDFIEAPPAIPGLVIEKTAPMPARLPPGSSIGRYTIGTLIGEGGMGEVYLSADPRLKRKVAVKVLPAALAADEERLRRFEQEAQAASALNHPNIITIFEIGESDGLNYIATEYIEGETLSDRMIRRSLDLQDVLDIATQISSALQAAHKAGIVHRDIKPDNVMIRPDGLVKILDFGIAKLTDQHPFEGGDGSTAKKPDTNPGVVIGTASYMSPEQARGLAVDARTDIWSLGVVLYEMVGGRSPFKGATLTDTIVAIIEKDPPPLKSVTARRIPGRLEAVIRKALQKKPDERYQTTGEIGVDIDAIRKGFESGETARSAAGEDPPATQVLERRVTAPREAAASRGVGNERAIAAALVLAVALAGVFGLYWMYWRGAAGRAPGIRSLAVLPLKSLDSATDYLGLGVADALIRRMSQTGKVVVRPTTSVRRFINENIDSLEAARQLGVDAILDGTFQRSSDRLRVSVELVRVADGSLLWSDSFDMRAADIFTLQDNVAQQLASRLQLRLDPAQTERLSRRSTSNPEAYEYYVKGMYSLDQRQFGKAAKPQLESTIALFKRAVDADPDYALARAQLAFCYAWMAVFVEPEQSWVDSAKEQLAQAERLDAQLPETRVVRHMILYSVFEGYKIEEAINELKAAQQLDPSVGHLELGHLYIHIGLEDMAEAAFERALEIDPTSEHIKSNIRGDYAIVFDYDKWLATHRKYFDGKPDVRYLMGVGRLDEAETMLKEELSKNPNDPGLKRRKAILDAVKGDFAVAESEVAIIRDQLRVKNLQYHHVTYDIACVYALMGRTEEAVKWLRETAETGFPSYTLFQRDRFLDPIRKTPEFTEFIGQMRTRFERYRTEFALQRWEGLQGDSMPILSHQSTNITYPLSSSCRPGFGSLMKRRSSATAINPGSSSVTRSTTCSSAASTFSAVTSDSPASLESGLSILIINP